MTTEPDRYDPAHAVAYASAALEIMGVADKLRLRREGKACGGCFSTGPLPHELDGLRYCDGDCWHGRP